jgi:molybdopterin adenylyltransferase
MGHLATKEFQSLNIAVLTVSDTRNEETDSSGRYLATAAKDAGHVVADKRIVIDDIYKIRQAISDWLASDNIQAVLVTGGTGFTMRDSTPEAVTPLMDKMVDGFGELFRQVSYDEIGTSTIQSRALAGMANGTVVFCMPGSTGACKTGWSIIESQLNVTHRPCNFVPHLKKDVELCESRG